jgi:DNA-binding SARP family transcriptional activator
MIHFDLALAYRVVTCTAKAIDHYESIAELDAPEPLKQAAKKFVDKLSQASEPFPN